MSVDADTVRRIATLARLKLDEASVPGLAGDLSRILGWVAQLDEADTEGVPPMAGVGHGLKRRTDEVTDGDCRDKVLANAPHHEDGFFTVPKVVE